MKSILLLFILISVKLHAQERPVFTNNSLIVKCQVKSRTRHYTPNIINNYTVDYFDRKGFMYKSQVLNPYSEIPVITIHHYQDSLGRKFASTTVTDSDSFHRIGYFEHYDSWAKSATVYYQYNDNNTLRRSYAFDTMSKKLLIETLYTYDPQVVIRKWYDENGLVRRESKDSLENDNFLVRSESRTYDSLGNMRTNRYENFINEYNTDGQLIETIYQSHKCPGTRVKYKYYKNGLIKLKKGDACLFNWIFEYEYYK